MNLGIREARELEEWQRLGLVLDRGGTQALVDDWVMGEAYGLPPVIVGRQLMDWLRTQLAPQAMIDIDRLDSILYIRNTDRLRGLVVQESLAQTGRGGPVNLRALRWAEFIYQEDPSCVGRAVVDGHWARQVFWPRQEPYGQHQETRPGNAAPLSNFLLGVWSQAWSSRETTETSGLGMVALWSVVRKPTDRQEAAFLWDACRRWEDLIPEDIAQEVRRSAISGRAETKDREDHTTRM